MTLYIKLQNSFIHWLFNLQNNPFSIFFFSFSLFNFLCDKISLVDKIPEWCLKVNFNEMKKEEKNILGFLNWEFLCIYIHIYVCICIVGIYTQHFSSHLIHLFVHIVNQSINSGSSNILILYVSQFFCSSFFFCIPLFCDVKSTQLVNNLYEWNE